MQILLFFLLFISSFYKLFSDAPKQQWVVTKGCSITVNGSTNVNKFNCAIANYNQPDTLTFHPSNHSRILKMTGKMKLPVVNFDCHNPMMSKDLQKTLKAKDFPYLEIHFISLSRYPNLELKNDKIKGVLIIKLAGVSKKIEIEYLSKKIEVNKLTLIGKKRITFSDFNIIPPRKIGGMIKTNNELDIEFVLNVKTL